MNKKPKILLVDDDFDFLEATRMILQSKPWDVITAKNGLEGIQKAREEKPDLILLDMMMPEKDGFTAATELQNDAELKSIPVLALTSFNTSFGSPFSIEVDEYIQKSILPDQLLERVQVHLQRIGFS
jgi:two-component system, OmpR family, alkaline phosphatase synthesis response regulator PhoP